MLSARARRLYVAEWGRLGLLPEPDDDEAALIAGVQQRAATVTSLDDKRPEGPGEVVTTATGPTGAPEARWPVLEGTLLTYNEEALIGSEPDGGGAVRERFLPGSVMMLPGTVVPLNFLHDQGRILGHVEHLVERDGRVQIRCRFVDSTPDGRTAEALIRSGTAACLSIEFVADPAAMKVTRSGGGRLVEHRAVALRGVGVVVAPAYRSAKVTKLFSRAEAGREKAAVRQAALDRLRRIGASDRAVV